MAHGKVQDVHAPVAVFETYRDDELALAKSMLLAADIPYYTKNEIITDQFGNGRLFGTNCITGPIELLVAPQDADDAYEIMKMFGRRMDSSSALKRVVRVMAMIGVIGYAALFLWEIFLIPSVLNDLNVGIFINAAPSTQQTVRPAQPEKGQVVTITFTDGHQETLNIPSTSSRDLEDALSEVTTSTDIGSMTIVTSGR